MDEALDHLLEQKRKEAAYWAEQFQDAIARSDFARVLALSVTQVTVLGDSANSLIQIGAQMSNQLQHLRIRAQKLENLTKWLIGLTIVLCVVTLPLSIESAEHLFRIESTGSTTQPTQSMSTSPDDGQEVVIDGGESGVAWYGGDSRQIDENHQDGFLQKGTAAMLVTYDQSRKWALIAPLMDEDMSRHTLPRTVWVSAGSIRPFGSPPH